MFRLAQTDFSNLTRIDNESTEKYTTLFTDKILNNKINEEIYNFLLGSNGHGKR